MKHFDFAGRVNACYVNLTVFDNNDQLFKYQDKRYKKMQMIV